jgi:hypothetical protein
LKTDKFQPHKPTQNACKISKPGMYMPVKRTVNGEHIGELARGDSAAEAVWRNLKSQIVTSRSQSVIFCDFSNQQET